MNTVQVQRVISPRIKTQGARVLVDRIWPRGISKERADLDAWLKEVAPSNETRKAYNHVPERFAAFRDAYLAELGAEPQRSALAQLRQMAEAGPITLLTGTREGVPCQADVLAEVLRMSQPDSQ